MAMINEAVDMICSNVEENELVQERDGSIESQSEPKSN